MYNIFKRKFTFEQAKAFFPILILCLVLMTALNLYFYKLEVDRYKANLSYNDTFFDELKWRYINLIIDEEYKAAGIQSKLIAERIDRDLKKEYPDLSLLKLELETFEDSNVDRKYKKIFKDSITSMYMHGINNDNNDAFVANRYGILMDIAINGSVDGFPRTWEVEVRQHTNKMLASDTIKKILLKSNEVKYWDNKPTLENINLNMLECDMKNLRLMYDKHGLEGLRHIEFLAPSYITENGDIFGIDDIDNTGLRIKNNKLVVVQGFNVYDQINARYIATYNYIEERHVETKTYLISLFTMRTIVVIFITCLSLFFILIMMIINNKMFHERDFCIYIKEKNEK